MADEKPLRDNPHRNAAQSQKEAAEAIQKEWDDHQTAIKDAAAKMVEADVEAAKVAADKAKAESDAAKQALQTAKANAKEQTN